MKDPAVKMVFFLLISLLASVPIISMVSSGTTVPTRGPEEDIRMDIEIEFQGITLFGIDVTVNIFKMTFGNVTYNSTVLRELFQIQPGDTEQMIDQEHPWR